MNKFFEKQLTEVTKIGRFSKLSTFVKMKLILANKHHTCQEHVKDAIRTCYFFVIVAILF